MALDELRHLPIELLVEWDEEICLVVKLLRVVFFRPEIREGVIVDVRWVGGRLAVIIVTRERRAFRVKEAAHQDSVQLVAEEGTQVCLRRMFLYGTHGRLVLADEPVCHQVMQDAPPQVDRHVTVRLDLVDGQLFLVQAGEMPLCIVHHEVLEVLRGACTAPLWIDDEAHVPLVKEVQQFLCTAVEFVVELVAVERDDLIEIDLVAVRQGTDRVVSLYLRSDNQGGGQLGVLGVVVCPAVDGMPPAEPSVVLDRQTCEALQQADRPVVLLVVLVDLPVGRQGNREFRAFELVLGELFWHVHAVRPHPEGDEHVVVPFLGRIDDADVQMDIRRDNLVKDVCIRAEVRLNVTFDGIQFFLGIDLRGHGLFSMRRIIADDFFHCVLLYD